MRRGRIMLNKGKKYYEELMLRMMVIRSFEEEVMRLYKEGAVHGTLHLCIGEEAADVGSTAVLKDEDYLFTTHRGHGACIGKGADIKAMMAEILGRSSGTNHGRGGSMHICDIRHGIIGSNGIVGADAPLACGAALTIKLRNIVDRVAVCFTGDGAANSGAVLESMNLAGIWKLPVIFVLLENHYAVSTSVERASADIDFSKRAEPFGLGCFETDGNDILAVADTMAKARSFVIEKKQPCLVIEHTYRIAGHSKSDRNRYRSRDEISYWEERSPIIRFRDRLIAEGICLSEEIEALERRAHEAVAEAAGYALAEPLADESAAELMHAVYAD